MREIKFRVWCDGMMLTPAYIGEFGEWYITGRDVEDGTSGKTHLMQFTGLKDKADKEIYEGDIIRVKHCEHIETIAIGDDGYKEMFMDVIGEVVSGDAAFHFTGHSMGEIPLYAYDDYDYEVIGNIYENPDLVLTS
jgi:uncharacterized phage protein (TIGR01671 family)